MIYASDSEHRVDQVKLEADLRDAYIELLSAQFAVDRLRLRYPAELLAMSAGSFLVNRSFAAARSIWEYFFNMQQFLGPNPREAVTENTAHD